MRLPLFTTMLLLLVVVAGCAPMSFLITPVSGRRALEEHVVQRESIWADKRIALIDVEGAITSTSLSTLLGGVQEGNSVSLLKEKLDHAARDERVKAVVLRINSPGGGVTASDQMYAEIRAFRERTKKPVIASLGDTAASGGYYVACAAERIVACPTTVTGSIGVIMMTPQINGLLSKIGAQMNVIKSAPMKDVGSPFREMTAEDRAVFQKIIDAMYERFLDVVANARPQIARERLRQLADGRVYIASDAVSNGLVDEIGSLPDVIRLAKERGGIGTSPAVVVTYARPAEYRANIYARQSNAAQAAEVNLINVKLPSWLEGDGPQFLYLWSPAAQ